MTPDKKAKRGQVRTHFPQNRLTALVERSGGLWRHEAIAEAARRVETMRESSMDSVDELIGKLEIIANRKDGDSQAQLKEIQRIADQVITLAGTFGLVWLTETAKRLCDLSQAFIARGQNDAGAVAVHVRAMRLFGPKAKPLAEDAAQNILLELRRVLEHFAIIVPEEPSDTLSGAELEAGAQ